MIKLFCGFFLMAIASPQPHATADLILYNGKIVTVDDSFDIYKAVAVKGDKILSTGSDEEIKKLAGKNTSLIDLKGKTVIPGLADAHAHPESASVSELVQQIPDVHSIPELLLWIQSQAQQKKNNEWIIHPKLFFTRLIELRQPTIEELDSIAPHNPVFLNGSYGGMVNTAALLASGISDETSNAGILRNSHTGRVTGFIGSSAFKLLKIPVAIPLYIRHI